VQEKTVWLLAVAAGVILLVAAFWQHSGGTAADLRVDGSVADSTTAPPYRLSDPVRVEVLNGCGVPRVAARLTRKARDLGMDVIDEGNAESFSFLQSMVIDRRGDLERARRVAASLGIPNCIQQISDDPSLLADVSIIIGGDYKQLRLLEP